MTKDQATKIVASLFASYIDSRPTEQNAIAYRRMIMDLDETVAEKAIARLIATSRFLPSIADIRATAAEFMHGPKRLGMEAWSDVIAEIRRVGAYGVPELQDPAAAECVRQMGWIRLCRGTNDAADRARFVELYDGMTQRKRQDMAASRALSGKVDGLVKGILNR